MEKAKVIDDNYVLFDNGVVLSLITNRFMHYWVTNNGYLQIKLNRKHYHLHRLLAQAFIENPNGFEFVDHIDRDKLNNNLSNLRWCTRSENGQNKSKMSNNKSGETGIIKSTNHGKPCWKVQVMLNGKPYTRFFKRNSDTIPQEAIDVRDKLKQELHGDFAFIPSNSA